MNNWYKLTEDNLPRPNMLVWAKRRKGSIYLASRQDKPLTQNPDPSKDCYWWGNPIDDALMVDELRQELKPMHNFSDVTVVEWQPVSTPS